MNNLELQPEVIQFCVNPALVELDDREYIADSHYSSWGLPSAEVVTPIAEAILHAIVANGIDPTSVVLSGYNRLESQESIDSYKRDTYATSEREAAEADIGEKIAAINGELAELHAKGILTQTRRAEARTAIEALRNERLALQAMPEVTKPTTYWFSEHASMFDNHTGDNNPIFYAGADHEGATIGIYDRARLAELETDEVPSGIETYIPEPGVHYYTVDLSREQLETAKVMEAHIHYSD